MKRINIWCLSLYIFSYLGVARSKFNYEKLKEINGSCHENGSCRRSVGFRLDHIDSAGSYCYCDELCLEYDDCCIASKSYTETKLTTYGEEYDCVRIEHFGEYYIKNKCSNSWNDLHTNELCLLGKSKTPRSVGEDIFTYLPVTSLKTDVTYGNYYCAVCNYEIEEDIVIWNALLVCPPSIETNSSYVKDNVKYSGKSWGVYEYGDKGSFTSCGINPKPHDSVNHKLRRCVKNINTCSPNWKNQEDVELCNAYMNILYGPPPSNIFENVEKSVSHRFYVAYRNYHCALCNFVHPSSINCYKKDTRQYTIFRYSPVSFSVLFDFGIKENNCEKGKIWDPFNKICKQVFCLDEHSSFRNGKCLKRPDNFNHSLIISNSTLKCDRVFVNESDIIEGENGTILVISLRQSFRSEDYEEIEDGILVCIPREYSKLMGWLTFVGLGTSCVCLMIHIIVFFVVPDIRNLSGKNLFCLCVSLLIAYVCFLISSFNVYNTYNCFALSHIMYYFFLSSFTWVNVMAFDIWQTLQRATSQLRLSSGRQWKKFCIYSIYSWTIPLIFVVFVISVDELKPEWLQDSYRPEMGGNHCWFGQANGILIYFAAPVAVIMAINLIFFALSVRIVAFSRRSTDAVTGAQNQKGQLKLYFKLALLMGLGWISGIVGGYIQEERLWYIFILLNAFQGLYILLGFTCSEKVMRTLKNKIPIGSFPKRSNKYEVKTHDTSNLDSNATQLSNTSSFNSPGNVSCKEKS